MKRKWLLLLSSLLSTTVFAGQVEVKYANISIHAGTMSAAVTLKHADTGWKHYADAWRIVDEKGKELGIRILYHPHVDEQPFTRSHSGILLPAGTRVIFVEARDTVHGWSKDRIRVELDKPRGKRYELHAR